MQVLIESELCLCFNDHTFSGRWPVTQKMTWEEIKKQYPNQWVSLVNVDYISEGIVKSGIVTAAGPDLKTVTRKLKKQGDISVAFKYTGRIKNFLGFTKWEITDVSADK